MAQKLLDEKELQEAINYQIISPSFAERVRELIKAYEQNAAQQSVQADKCPDCGGSGFMVKIDNRKVSCSYCDGTGICR